MLGGKLLLGVVALRSGVGEGVGVVALTFLREGPRVHGAFLGGRGLKIHSVRVSFLAGRLWLATISLRVLGAESVVAI